MEKETINYILFFGMGMLSCILLFLIFSSGEIEKPFGYNSSVDLGTPSDWISLDDIVILEDRVIIKINNASLSRYASTGSMKPLLDEKANGIRVKPDSSDDVKVGDIVSFRSSNGLIVHRVIEKGVDGQGIYFITRGDNAQGDDGKIRFQEIEYVTIAILW